MNDEPLIEIEGQLQPMPKPHIESAPVSMKVYETIAKQRKEKDAARQTALKTSR